MLLHKDPRWKEFAETYAYDLARFAIEVCGMTPRPERGDVGMTWQQMDIADEVSKAGCRVSIASGHGTGKTRTLGVTALWHLTCYYMSNMVITAPKIDQVRNGAWKEISDMHMTMQGGKFAWLADHITVEAERVYIKGYKKEQWYVIAKTAPKGSPENLAGEHRDWLLIWADEGSGIPDANYGVMLGAMSDERNRFVITSQPTRPAGYFYQTHHDLSVSAGGNWIPIALNSEESPIVSVQSIKRWRKEYGGKDSAIYGIKVLGRFPDKSDGFMLAESEVRATLHRPPSITNALEHGLWLIADVGEGTYRDESVLALAKVSGYGEYYDSDARRVDILGFPVISAGLKPLTFAGRIYTEWLKRPESIVLIDIGGVGISVAEALESKGVPVFKIRWGTPCFKESNRELYGNMRAHASWSAAEAVKDGRLTIASGDWDAKLVSQGARIPYYFDEKARLFVMSKDDMKAIGLKSPDLWDVVCFCFLEGSYYNVIGGSGGQTDGKSAAESAADAMLAELEKQT